jgi:hypothetical protein
LNIRELLQIHGTAERVSPSIFAARIRRIFSCASTPTF